PASSHVAPQPPAAAAYEPAREVEPAAASPAPDAKGSPRATQTLAEEMQWLEQAQTALDRGDAQRALTLLAEHTWRFPKGKLAEARDVARILALCSLGRSAQARSLAQRFLHARGASPFSARVRASCAGP
ncbi:MAG TPA: hypothetical protein VJR89_24805, partial [Polyangiales bacterium]|nr:hypothetical protein [Polyangiales bacterium]